MSPEQARAAAEVDQRADVYGLGGILYLLLTGENPGDHAVAALSAHRAIPRPLRSICARALAADPGARYPTVEALSDDVARYRSGDAVRAHRETPWERLARFGRSYRTAILLVLAYIVMRALVAALTGF
jgi:serine/threonine-protein kinase